MAESLALPETEDKEEIYKSILPQIEGMMEGERNMIANLANICAILDMAFQHLWTGFYLRDHEDTEHESLVLGPFQGPLACMRIPLSPVARGVCGAAAEQKKTQLVPDVEKFPGHIACSSAARSEIVVPLVDDHGITQLVLDIDSTALNMFDEIDQKYCEQIIAIIKNHHF